MSRNPPNISLNGISSTTTGAPWATPDLAPAFNTMFHVYAGWLSQTNRLQAEVSNFIGNRFERDVEALKQFGACKKPEEFLSLQSAFASGMISDYLEESRRLLGLFNDGLLAEIEEANSAAAKAMPSSRKTH